MCIDFETLRGMSRMADILQSACDDGAQAQMQAFLDGPLSGALGPARLVSHARERIARCIAFHKAVGPDLSAALAAAH